MDLEVRVRKTMTAKDDTIKALKTRLEETHLRNLHLEKIMEKQRMV